MSTTDALTITSAPDALTKYYDAKEREENAVLYINDAYLEVLNSLEKLEAENAKLRTFIDLKETCWKYVGWCDECPYNGVDDEHDDCNCTVREKVSSLARELGIEVDK
jgi:hypothetical protein